MLSQREMAPAPAKADADAKPDGGSVAVLAGHLFLSCLGISLLLQARPQLVLNLAGGDASKAGARLSRWTALASAFEQ